MNEWMYIEINLKIANLNGLSFFTWNSAEWEFFFVSVNLCSTKKDETTKRNTFFCIMMWCLFTIDEKKYRDSMMYAVVLMMMMILMLYCQFSSVFVHVKLIWFLCLNLSCRSMPCHLHNISLISAIKTLIDGWMNMSESAGDE